ncbi:hypothetical protein [Bifidobacterium sp. H6bp9]|uniref:hypothetical protein n=1 Tax=Bifidobacterium sp. H6bp9 TaxID=3051961 RepID=UPI0028BEA9CD|nr:hypothetical protein [Bifidobacterium sp. H6bp9]MDT7510587.1 hypothetical protein [Bifidobacterium sp. H6bp9]
MGGRGGCTCSCGGVNHGIGRIDWASNPTSSDYQNAQIKACKRLNGLKKISKPKVLPSQHSVRILQEHIRTVEIVTWLINNNQSGLQPIEKLRKEFQKAATKAIKELPKKQIERFSDHFWCDFFASLVCWIDKEQDAEEQINQFIAGQISDTFVDAVFKLIKDSRETSYGNSLATKPGNRVKTTRDYKDSQAGLTKKCLKDIVTAVLVASFKSYSSSLDSAIKNIKVHFQVLALLLCPDPESHKLVWDHCLAPLFAAQCAQGLKDILTNKNIFIPVLDTWDSPNANTPTTPVSYIK